MELKEGMYVSTVDRKEIGRITHFCDCEYCEERGYFEPFIDNPNIFITNYDKNNKFHGYKFYDNILDLIQPGDLVELSSKYCKDEIYQVISSDDGCIMLNCFGDGYMTIDRDEEIKRVLTKEQLAAIAYEVKK